ncbi:hypothetical protein MGSAQ_002278, partial [marine sediment metagenome]
QTRALRKGALKAEKTNVAGKMI